MCDMEKENDSPMMVKTMTDCSFCCRHNTRAFLHGNHSQGSFLSLMESLLNLNSVLGRLESWKYPWALLSFRFVC
jgi:hypothetical protein